jgi:hypothetical protein
MRSVEDVTQRALAGGRWCAPDLRELRARGYDTGAEPVYCWFGLCCFMAGEPYVIWDDHSTTSVSEIADPAGGWEPIGDDVTPVDPPPVGTKRWLEALAASCTGVAATARNLCPGTVLVELAGEPRPDSVGAFVLQATQWCKVAIEIRWTEKRDVFDAS